MKLDVWQKDMALIADFRTVRRSVDAAVLGDGAPLYCRRRDGPRRRRDGRRPRGARANEKSEGGQM